MKARLLPAATAALLCACAHNIKFPKAALPDATVGVEYNAKLDLGSCDTRVNTSSVESGKLPPGIGVSYLHESEAHNAVLLQGMPRDAGTFKFTLGATCKGMEEDEVTGRYSMKVIASEGVAGLHFDDKNPPNGAVGKPYDHMIPIGKCEGKLEEVDVPKGKLPTGLKAEPAADEAGDVVHLSGTPKKAGTFKFTLLAGCGSPEHTLEQGAQLTHIYTIKVTK